MAEESLVGINEASHILGVSEPALRQWTDEGKIKAFITPGGHRRYSKSELKKLMSSHQKMLGVKDLATKLADTVQIHREIGLTFLHSTTWYNKLSPESQEQLASPGRNLLKLIIKYVTEPAKREDTIKQTRDVGHDFGETLARLGLPLTDSVQAFILHRDPVMNAATSLLKQKDAFSERIAGAIPLMNHTMDEALVALVAAHQQYREVFPDKTEGRGADDFDYTSTL